MAADQLWRHPQSGRLYREGDPAHDFARLTHALHQMAAQFVDQYERRLAGRDYLVQHQMWDGDPDRIARLMADMIAKLDKAYTRVHANRTLPDYGLGQRDEEWQRRYGPVVEVPDA